MIAPAVPGPRTTRGQPGIAHAKVLPADTQLNKSFILSSFSIKEFHRIAMKGDERCL